MSLVDVELILSIVDGDRAEAATLISVFFDSAQEQTSAMEAAIRSGDAHALSRAAHQIAGAAGTCGFAEIERNFREIELQAENGGGLTSMVRISEIRDLLARALAEAREAFPGEAASS